MKKVLLFFLVIYICQYSFPQNWFPLNKGNQWHYIDFGAVTMYPPPTNLYGYTHRFTKVLDSTIIDGKTYYKFNNFFKFSSSTPIRYDSIAQQILIYLNGSDNLFMDFSLEDSATFMQILPNGNFGQAEVRNARKIILGDTILIKGFYRITMTFPPYYRMGDYYFAENIGFVFQNEYVPEAFPEDDWNDYTLGEYLVKVDGIQYHKKHDYIADIRFNPITYLPSSTFVIQQFKIYHPLSFYQYWWNDTYIDSAFIDFFYSNGIDTLQKGKSWIPATSEVDFNLNFQIDTIKYNQGYHLFYRIIAKDRGIFPSYYYEPDNLYYKLFWRDSTASSIEDEKLLSTKFSLEQNYPNPFNPSTSIQYAISSRQFVQIKVYDVLGKELATLVNEEKPAGSYKAEFNGSALASGIYYYQIKSGEFIQTKKMILLK